MVMALSLFYLEGSLTLVAGYEDGVAIVSQLGAQQQHGWSVKYHAKCHSQPILSLDVAPSRDFFLSSSADAGIAKHPLPRRKRSLAKPAVSGEHEGGGEGGLADSGPEPVGRGGGGGRATAKESLLSAASAEDLDQDQGFPTVASPPQTADAGVEGAEPIKVVNTKHSGQQSLRIRSDGRIFATAGWDSKVRVYSTKTLKEVAVLKWHQAGCYAAAFAEVDLAKGHESIAHSSGEEVAAGSDVNAKDTSSSLVPRLVELTVRDKRIRQAKTAHWLVAGSKDGKVSLWDIF
jgi:ASTRA-associated protein 1